MPASSKTREIVKECLKNSSVDEAILDYIISGIETGEAASDVIVPLLIESEVCCNEQEASSVYNEIISKTHAKDNNNSGHEGEKSYKGLVVLDKPIRIEEDPPPLSPPLSSKDEEEIDNYVPLCDIQDREVVTTIEQYIERTKDPDPKARKLALRAICPCHVKKDFDLFLGSYCRND